MSDELWAAAIGATAATVATTVTLYFTQREARKQRKEDLAIAHKVLVRDAYVEWLAAMNRSVLKIPRMIQSLSGTDNTEGVSFLTLLQEDPVFNGTKLKLIDPDPAGTGMVDKFIKHYISVMVQIAHQDRVAHPSERAKIAGEFGAELRQITHYLRGRFALSVGEPDPALTKGKQKAAKEDD
jgi:hypothetical protein